MKFVIWILGTLSLLISIILDIIPNKIRLITVPKLEISYLTFSGFCFYFLNLIGDVIFYILLPKNQFVISSEPPSREIPVTYEAKFGLLFWEGLISLILLILIRERRNFDIENPKYKSDPWPSDK